MKIDTDTGRLMAARFVSSPNCDARPVGMSIDVLVIHAISLPPGEFGGPYIEQLFCNRLDAEHHEYFREIHGLQVSAHFLIRRDGELVQFVATTQRAWHAGESCCLGRTQVNDFSIGIELEGSDEAAFADPQYTTLCELTIALRTAYPALDSSHWFAHSEISAGRKTDPGPHFDWARYVRLVKRAESS